MLTYKEFCQLDEGRQAKIRARRREERMDAAAKKSGQMPASKYGSRPPSVPADKRKETVGKGGALVPSPGGGLKAPQSRSKVKPKLDPTGYRFKPSGFSKASQNRASEVRKTADGDFSRQMRRRNVRDRQKEMMNKKNREIVGKTARVAGNIAKPFINTTKKMIQAKDFGSRSGSSLAGQGSSMVSKYSK
jgi:hypothetical protein